MLVLQTGEFVEPAEAGSTQAEAGKFTVLS